jgi:hypothetical protein
MTEGSGKANHSESFAAGAFGGAVTVGLSLLMAWNAAQHGDSAAVIVAAAAFYGLGGASLGAVFQWVVSSNMDRGAYKARTAIAGAVTGAAAIASLGLL